MTSPDLRHDPRYRLAFLLVTIALLTLALLRMLAPLWSALAWAAFLAFLLFPLHHWLTARLRGHASASAGLLTILTPFVILGPWCRSASPSPPRWGTWWRTCGSRARTSICP